MPERKGRTKDQWILVVFGIALIVAAFVGYDELASWEAAGGKMRMNWLEALAYKIGGKLTVSVLVALMGLFFFAAGWFRWGSKPE